MKWSIHFWVRATISSVPQRVWDMSEFSGTYAVRPLPVNGQGKTIPTVLPCAD